MQTFPDNSTSFSNKEGNGNEKEKSNNVALKIVVANRLKHDVNKRRRSFLSLYNLSAVPNNNNNFIVLIVKKKNKNKTITS